MFFCKKNVFVQNRLNIVHFCTNSSIKKWLETFVGGSVNLTKFNENISLLSLNNELTHNSLTGSMMSQLDDCIKSLEEAPSKAVIVGSKMGSFCSGANLNFVESIANPMDGNRMCQFMQLVTSRLSKLPSITFALIEGVAYGGGAELALNCDFRFMASNGKISFKQRHLGVTTGWGGGPKLIELIGKQKSLKLLLKANVLKAEEAQQSGLIDLILSTDSAEKRFIETQNIIETLISDIPNEVLFAIKKEINELSSLNSEMSLKIERQIFSSVWGSSLHCNILKKLRT